MRISIFIYPDSHSLQRKRSLCLLLSNPAHLPIRHLDHRAGRQLPESLI